MEIKMYEYRLKSIGALIGLIIVTLLALGFFGIVFYAIIRIPV